ncbi:MAG: protein phosphatase 2C domain-containing protein [Acetobacter sp.]|nr:protein phosphatase 2C domain-containing protein [Acetobacter sp.]
MKRTPKNIRVIATKITGRLHTAKKMPCQDFYQYACSGNKLVAVVSDGAGSAKYGKIGAKIVCETLVNVLINTPLKDVEQAVRRAIEKARERLVIHRLNKSKSEKEILNFSATVVGVAYHKNRGIFFHIGDGAGIALHGEDKAAGYTLSRPANGNFSCETYFYTMDNWAESLRFTKIEKAAALFLMTDGVTNFALTEDMRQLKNGFIEPIYRYLKTEPNKIKALQALNNTLNTGRACKLNSDDKTFLWAEL